MKRMGAWKPSSKRQRIASYGWSIEATSMPCEASSWSSPEFCPRMPERECEKMTRGHSPSSAGAASVADIRTAAT